MIYRSGRLHPQMTCHETNMTYHHTVSKVLIRGLIPIGHGCELQSADADFARFAKLKWKNPLKGVSS